MIHITLVRKTPINDPDDPLPRTHYGWDEDATIEENWDRNRGYYILGERADRQNYAAFSFKGRVVLMAKIHRIVDAKGRPGKRIIEGTPLGRGEPIWDAFVGETTPAKALAARNPVVYIDEGAAFGRPCGCGCGDIVWEGRFARGHEQTALHQRVTKIGTISDFVDWFDEVYAGRPAPGVGAPETITAKGVIEVTIDDGELSLHFAPEPVG